MAFRIFLMLYNHRLYAVPKHFITPKISFRPWVAPTPPTPEPLGTIDLLFVSMDLPFPDSPYKWNPYNMRPFVPAFIHLV